MNYMLSHLCLFCCYSFTELVFRYLAVFCLLVLFFFGAILSNEAFINSCRRVINV